MSSPSPQYRFPSFPSHYHLDKRYLPKPVVFGHCHVYQIGRLYCTAQTVVGKHAHVNLFELTIVTGGLGTVYTNDIGTAVKRGDIYLSFPGDFHAIVSDEKEPLKYDFFAFTTDDDAISRELDHIMQTHGSAHSRVIRDERIASLVGEALGEIDSTEAFSHSLLSSLFNHVLIRTVRGFLYDTASASRTTVTDSEALCYQLMNYIDTHIYTMSGLEELAESTNYNYSYLSSLFHKTTAGTLADYYRQRRLETARLLILENTLRITEIAELLHYSSIYTCSRAFKDEYGISPLQYRKEHPLSELPHSS